MDEPEFTQDAPPEQYGDACDVLLFVLLCLLACACVILHQKGLL